MSDYISRDELKEALLRRGFYPAFVKAALEEAPAIDIVRCKDCAREGLGTCPLCYIEKQALIFINHDPEFFCAYGERRDNDGEIH